MSAFPGAEIVDVRPREGLAPATEEGDEGSSEILPPEPDDD